MAMVYIQNFIPESGDMKTNSISVFEGFARFQLFFGKPPVICERELKFVPVVVLFFASENLELVYDCNLVRISG